MSRWLCLLLLGLTIFGLALRAQAAPSTQPVDDVERLLADRGLLTQLSYVRQSLSSRASELVVNAMGFLGVPYRRGGNNAETGFDCSGFVRAMYEQTVGLVLPRRADQQAAATQTIDKQELQPGDLVFFNTMRHAFSHVGIYVGDGKFIHSPRTGSQIRVEDMRDSYWQRRFDGARRVNVPSVSASTDNVNPR
ncbi:MAG: C40 family peptidase [Curvibacter lanceolatus]|jgi:cell wall-associated NlpC family hydrolase|uniref:C40 family peptidase n=1 Tax=Curvibacter lanceolatus TaxID=86182 RepID=UPI00068493DC|nr:C40 family peptidase [Curvibacter lanceolatus]MBV5295260.1 C40 family peptidase [Curvibacter lanceolatus]